MPPATRPHTSPILVHAALFAVALLFGGNYVVAKFAFREVDPLTLVVLRTWGAVAILFGASAAWRRVGSARVSAVAAVTPHPVPRAFSSRDYRDLVLFSLLGVTINQVCFLEGLSRSTATNASILLVSIPLLTLAIAVLLRRERASVAVVAGIGIGLAGALVLILPKGNLSAGATTGNLLLLCGCIAYAFYLVLTRDILARHDPLRVVCWIFLFSGITVLPFGIGGMRALLHTGLTAAGWASVLYVTIGATVLTYLLNSWALVRVQSTVVGVYILVQPIVASVLGRIFLGEHLGPNAAVAAALVVTGVLLAAFGPRSRAS